MAPRIIVGIIAVACISVCGLLSTFASFEMVDKVNDKLPETEKFDYLGWYYSKRVRLNDKYKMLYPEGRLLRRVRLLTVLAFACLFIAAYCFGFLPFRR
jgi:hypothetical protein